MADSKLTALSETSVPALADLTYTVADPAGTPASNKLTLSRLAGALFPSICQGRLTTETGVPVSTSDRTAQSTLYFTPYCGNRIGLYDGTRWALYSFTERSIALSGLTSGKNYDVFLYDNSGSLTLELLAWTDDTTRATALALQDGVYVKTGATTRRYLGTIRTTSTTTTEDSVTKRFVWNAQNRVTRRLQKTDTTGSWTYSSSTIRQARGDATNQVEIVTGLAVSPMSLIVGSTCSGGGVTGQAGIGEDSTTALAAEVAAGNYPAWAFSSISLIGFTANHLLKTAPLGYHYYAWLENVTNNGLTATFYGDDTTALRRCGLIGGIEC